jgi:hypothetical protein
MDCRLNSHITDEGKLSADEEHTKSDKLLIFQDVADCKKTLTKYSEIDN